MLLTRLGDWSAPLASIVVLIVIVLASTAFAHGFPANVILSFGLLFTAIAGLISFTAVTSLDPKNRDAHDHEH